MTNIFIIHGAYGHPNENWIPWLKSKLEKLDCQVLVPQFPTPENQNLLNWLKILNKYKNLVNKDTIFVGYSISCTFVLNVIERLKKPIKAAYLVAGWTGLLNDPLDEINKTFVDRKFNWKKIKTNCNKFYVFNSDNDPYISQEKGRNLARNLGVDLILVKNAGHFNETAGYTKFELLLEKIKQEL